MIWLMLMFVVCVLRFFVRLFVLMNDIELYMVLWLVGLRFLISLV